MHSSGGLFHVPLCIIIGFPFFHEDSHHIYVHAGLNPQYENWKEQTKHEFMYIKEPFLNHPTTVDKIVVFGHTKAMDIHGKADVWFGGDKIGIDGGCAYGLQLNCLEIRGKNDYAVYSVNCSHHEQPSEADGIVLKKR
ncbi:hypothetical protein Back11_36790 [Paenibacillus baekrokdamisoli]|uniref:Calcineurin-like phosphoesterase domain-containing protein n=3 Tax=Paenibacillus baekrokdamisoli TaxID=1712516 RepID=A0A3G9JGV4_9BACL|nr:hypothetical protein Back11_36790 [Paenibacillus baekrokdamisoli]